MTPQTPPSSQSSQRKWWPITPTGTYLQLFALVAALYQGRKEGLFWGISLVLFTFFLLTALRCGAEFLTSTATQNAAKPSSGFNWSQPGWLSVGYLVLHYALILPRFEGQGDKHRSITASQSNRERLGIEERLIAKVQIDLSHTKQELFSAIHPTGTATDVKVHDVAIKWRSGRPETEENIEQFTVRFTLYWKGPIISDGFTKATRTYDAESKRWIEGKILHTNGITNGETFDIAGAILSELLSEE